MHAFSICATALGKRPPAPPSHSASYNITSNHHHHHDHYSTNYNASIQYKCHCLRKNTTTTAITQCKLQYYGQPPLPPPPPPRPPQHKLQCMQSVYAPLLGEKKDHQCKLLWAWSSTSTLQTTACAKEYMHTVVKDKDHQHKLQRVKTTLPPLVCTMQQALVTCIRACH